MNNKSLYQTVERFFKLLANPSLFFVYFDLFTSQINYKLKKNIDGVLGIQTRGRRVVGVDKTTELWRPQMFINVTVVMLLGLQ